jgi:hypothetical protein
MRKRAFIIPCAFLALAFWLTGCSPFSGTTVGSGQPDTSQSALILTPGKTIGQTFTTHQAGLTGIEVYLRPQLAGDGQVFLKLFKGPQDTQTVAEAHLDLHSNAAPDWYRFTFSALPGENAADFYFSLQFEGVGQVVVGSAAGASYVDGSAYQDGQPALDSQLAFQQVYNNKLMLLGLVQQGGQWLLWLGLAAILYIFPGWVLLGALWEGWQAFFIGEKLGLAIGVSLAIYPLLLLWTNLVGLHLGVWNSILPAGCAFIFVLYRFLRQAVKNKPIVIALPRRLPAIHPADVALLGVAGLVFGVRLYVTHSLALPLWGDSYQHTVITQLILDHGGLFQSWQPYAQMADLTYHFGFHGLAAVFGWAAGMQAPQAVIWFGQILNGLAILALYPLVVRLSHNRWAGVIATLVGGLLVSMPMFYVNWGRYTQLAGQAILPAVVCLVWAAIQGEGKGRKVILLAGVAIGGLALTHYRILILAILFILPVLIFEKRAGWRLQLLKVLQIGLIGGLLFLPWFIHIYGGQILATFGKEITTPASANSAFMEQYNSAGPLTDYLPILVWLLLIMAVGWGLWRRDRASWIVSTWIFLIILATNPAWVHLPGTGVISNFAILIAAYIPASIFIGAAGGWLIEAISFQRNKIFTGLIMVGVVIIGAWGGIQRLKDAQFDQFTYATRADLRASAWIQANLPLDATFLVNSFPAYGGTIMAGADGGWWLQFLSGRKTTLPPLLYVSEPPPNAEFIPSVNNLTALIFSKGIAAPETQVELARRGIRYIYIGQMQGHTANGGPFPLEPASLAANPQFNTIYHQDRVWIFEIKAVNVP